MQLRQDRSAGVSGSELQYLHELQDVDDLREGDIELACSNLGLDLDYQEYFINRLAGA